MVEHIKSFVVFTHTHTRARSRSRSRTQNQRTKLSVFVLSAFFQFGVGIISILHLNSLFSFIVGVFQVILLSWAMIWFFLCFYYSLERENSVAFVKWKKNQNWCLWIKLRAEIFSEFWNWKRFEIERYASKRIEIRNEKRNL